MISVSPPSQFWSSIVASYRSLISVDFVEEQCDLTLEDVLPALLSLLNLFHLQINIENIVETESNTYFFLAVEVVETTFFQDNEAIQFFKAIHFSCLKRLDVINFNLTIFSLDFSQLLSLKLHIVISEQGVSEMHLQEGIPGEELQGKKLSEMSLHNTFYQEKALGSRVSLGHFSYNLG